MYIRCIGSITISVIDSGAADRRFEPRSGYNKAYDIDILILIKAHTIKERGHILVGWN